jgi:N-acetyl-anhydromuramyl-L-alanine amidase AmpD
LQGSAKTRLALLAAALALAAVAVSAASGARLNVLVLKSGNHTDSNRTAETIDELVVHATEGRFLGSVRWLRNHRSRGSSHYVVSRRGEVVQLVSVTDVAWHAGNAWVNRHSIGIEHEGWTYRGGFTDSQYRASARLAAYLATRYSIPLDREHVIGHNEVPNPRRPGAYGGSDGHQDPGRRWNWGKYMKLVRYFAAHPEQPKYVRRMAIKPSLVPSLGGGIEAAISKVRAAGEAIAPATPAPRRAVVDRGATVRGHALWWSGVTSWKRWQRGIRKVEFAVDGKVLWTDHTWPFSFRAHTGWDTTTVANGRHMLVVRAYGRRGFRSRKSIPVRVANPPLRLTLPGTGAGVRGITTIPVRVSEKIERVALYVDGVAVSRDGSAPYSLVWDTRGAAEGPHDVIVYARGRNGRRVAEQLSLMVANSPDIPPSLELAWHGKIATE